MSPVTVDAEYEDMDHGYLFPDCLPGSARRGGYEVPEGTSLGGEGGCIAVGNGLGAAVGSGGVGRQVEVQLHHVGEDPVLGRGKAGEGIEADREGSELTPGPVFSAVGDVLRSAGEFGGAGSSVGDRSEADSEESELTWDPAAIPTVPIVSDRRGNNI